ncbi:MAG: LapA family protein [Thermodesulfobacteriota bacterium]
MRFRLVLVVVLLLAVVLFTLQNTEMVTVRFFLWSYDISRALLIFLVFAMGVLLGLCAGSFPRRREKAAPPSPPQPHPKDSSHDQRTTP